MRWRVPWWPISVLPLVIMELQVPHKFGVTPGPQGSSLLRIPYCSPLLTRDEALKLKLEALSLCSTPSESHLGSPWLFGYHFSKVLIVIPSWTGLIFTFAGHLIQPCVNFRNVKVKVMLTICFTTPLKVRIRIWISGLCRSACLNYTNVGHVSGCIGIIRRPILEHLVGVANFCFLFTRWLREKVLHTRQLNDTYWVELRLRNIDSLVTAG